jgi:hypothetical protein
MAPRPARLLGAALPLGRTVAGEVGEDLRLSGIAGFMDDPKPDEEG